MWEMRCIFAPQRSQTRLMSKTRRSSSCVRRDGAWEGQVPMHLLMIDRWLRCHPIWKESFEWKGAVKPGWVPTAGLNKQSGLNCTGRAPSTRGSGYRRVYGETTKHAPEASVLMLSSSSWSVGTEESCCLTRPGYMIWAEERAQSRSTTDDLSYAVVLRSQG